VPERRQLADRNAVAGDDECLAAIQRAHDLAAFVPKLSLTDLSRHIPNCSTCATPCSAALIRAMVSSENRAGSPRAQPRSA
jgi:hypothetical protein